MINKLDVVFESILKLLTSIECLVLILCSRIEEKSGDAIGFPLWKDLAKMDFSNKEKYESPGQLCFFVE